MIGKGDFEEMRWSRNYLKFLMKDLEEIIIFLVKILGDHSEDFGNQWRKSCESEFCRSLFWKKYKNNLLRNVLKKEKYLF
jgi:hypothetical protein